MDGVDPFGLMSGGGYSGRPTFIHNDNGLHIRVEWEFNGDTSSPNTRHNVHLQIGSDNRTTTKYWLDPATGDLAGEDGRPPSTAHRNAIDRVDKSTNGKVARGFRKAKNTIVTQAGKQRLIQFKAGPRTATVSTLVLTVSVGLLADAAVGITESSYEYRALLEALQDGRDRDLINRRYQKLLDEMTAKGHYGALTLQDYWQKEVVPALNDSFDRLAKDPCSKDRRRYPTAPERIS